MTDLIVELEDGKLFHILLDDGKSGVIVVTQKGSIIEREYKEDYDAKIREALMKLEAEMRRRPRGEEPTGEEFRTFLYNLADRLEKEGFKVHVYYPDVRVLFYYIDNKGKRPVIYWGPEVEKIATASFSVDDVINKLKEVHKIITERPFDDKEFLSRMYEAYRRCMEGGYSSDDSVPVKCIIPELYKGYDFKWGRVFLGYDLFRLKERVLDGRELRTVTATRAHTEKSEDFIWVPVDLDAYGTYLYGGTYISHIKFREHE
ncbi:hypothetical protein [Candidatus Methanodesulfokora washburnensis]|uniref:Uncharacterized protein n=1 Tax=Candidatus Methanodesulfokora washburnensis TaxID=2478471 RepID=A0A429GGU0_9CREN|nr:hypothetical protein [Candidatus Methanodesulfokores washburnensis]RSN72976.1 hypothetical protein D6D85_11840 [Candidatus Methanodesulfokores washburnensis]